MTRTGMINSTISLTTLENMLSSFWSAMKFFNQPFSRDDTALHKTWLTQVIAEENDLVREKRPKPIAYAFRKSTYYILNENLSNDQRASHMGHVGSSSNFQKYKLQVSATSIQCLRENLTPEDSTVFFSSSLGQATGAPLHISLSGKQTVSQDPDLLELKEQRANLKCFLLEKYNVATLAALKNIAPDQLAQLQHIKASITAKQTSMELAFFKKEYDKYVQNAHIIKPILPSSAQPVKEVRSGIVYYQLDHSVLPQFATDSSSSDNLAVLTTSLRDLARDDDQRLNNYLSVANSKMSSITSQPPDLQ
ncbi:hypothetical protein MMC13_001236 [Lambiella insularis]|nr:hypothetical protein [Lambiella insularis]